MTPIQPTLTPEEVCAIFRVSRRTLDRWTKNELLPAIRFGHLLRFSLAVINKKLGDIHYAD
jgi:excisionase family DNA binding protein